MYNKFQNQQFVLMNRSIGIIRLQECIFCHEVLFFRMCLPIALEVYDRLFIDCSGFMAVDTLKKSLPRLTQ